MKEGTVYFRDGELIKESGDVRVYRMDDELYLDAGPGHNLISKGSDLKDYIWQIRNKPKGKCLLIGLGLGTSANYILSLPKVESLIILEDNIDVINLYKEINPIRDDRIDIIYDDLITHLYQTNTQYDFVFVDCYSYIDEDSLPFIADIVAAARKVLKVDGIVAGWLDNNTPEVFIEYFFKLFN
jgi:hypothetical protein